MRYGLTRAVQHSTYRHAFGAALVDQPLMRNVLADLAVESEAATVLALRLAGATDRAAAGDEGQALFRRLGVAVSKYWVCKRAPWHAAEALECLGGNGYIEESGMPRLYREAPLLSIWEGSGNVVALDALRAATRQPGTVQALLDEVALARGADRRLDEAVRALGSDLAATGDQPYTARRVAERMALVLQGSLLVRHGHPAIADAFCASRLQRDHGGAFGTLPTGVDVAAILDRARPGPTTVALAQLKEKGG
jgi:putative acyl-CoA dehydrogenase